MKSPRSYLLPVLALAVFVPQAWAQKEVIIRRIDQPAGPHSAVIHPGAGPVEKEPVTFLGVETAPAGRTLGAQLGLGRDTGLVVTHIVEKSPAAEVLKVDDVLTKLDDQVLVNPQQLGVLVRARKEGDEAALTVIRGGKATTVKAKLGSREVPKMAGQFFPQNGPAGGMSWTMATPSAGFPGMNDEDAKDVLRMIGREHRNFTTGPGMRTFRIKRGHGSTILDLPNSNISYSDDAGSIDIKADEGKRTLTVKDAKGKVTFEGPINTDDERKQLPSEVLKQLEKLDNDTINFEAGEKFEHEVLPLPGEPAKTKIRQEIRRPAAEPPLRAL